MQNNEIRYKLGVSKSPRSSTWQRFLMHVNNVPYLRSLFIKIIKNYLELPNSCSFGIGFYCNFFEPHNLKVGEKVSFNDTFILLWAPVIIGEGTSFSYHNKIITSTHDYEDWGTVIGKSVVIGKYCWITTGVTILPGVTIGDHTIIGAGSVVTHDIPSGVFAAGNPCRVIKTINFRGYNNQ